MTAIAESEEESADSLPSEEALAGLEEHETSVEDFISLPSGSALSEQQAQALALDRPVRLIVLAGAVDCGKTTLLTSIYELFQGGPVDDIHFAGSATLPAFEQRCHLSRSKSESDTADTIRTPYDGPNPEFLHLKVRNNGSLPQHTDLLLTDVSGEMFEHARNSTSECKRLTFLKRACHLILFLDCKKALLPDEKWSMVQDGISLIRSCLDSFMLGPSCLVTVLWSRFDFFEAAEDKETAVKFVGDVEADFKKLFGERISKLEFHRVAARPTQYPQLKNGYGVAELLNCWVNKWPQLREMQIQPPQYNVYASRESEFFLMRHCFHSAPND